MPVDLLIGWGRMGLWIYLLVGWGHMLPADWLGKNGALDTLAGWLGAYVAPIGAE